MNEREGILPASVVQIGFTQVVLVLPLPMCLKILFASSANIKIGVLISAVRTAENWKVFRLLWQHCLYLNPDLSRTQLIHFFSRYSLCFAVQILTLWWLLQIQRLLEAQAHQAGSSEAVAARLAVQEKPGDLVSMETQTSPPAHKRKSVSVAVSTGNASSFQNTLAPLFLDFSVVSLSMQEMFCRNAEAVQTAPSSKKHLSC